MEYSTILFALALAFGLYMAWGIGANDVANAMATSVGAKALTVKQAILVAQFTRKNMLRRGWQLTQQLECQVEGKCVADYSLYLSFK